MRWLGLALLLLPARHPFAAEPEAGVVELAVEAPDQDADWRAVLAQKGSADWPKALDAWLKLHPHGPQAAAALIEQAGMEDDLVKAAATLRLARGEAEGTVLGSRAALELARLDYAQERTESALAGLEQADSWPRDDAMEPDWLYWKAQCRLVLKGVQRARDDFEHLAAAWPKHPRAPLALLGQAECDSLLKAYERAEPVFQALSKPGAPYAAQALWDWAGMKQRQGDYASARQLYERLKKGYPASFEAASVDEKLAALPAPQATPVPPKPNGFSVQVGAFSRKSSADKLAARLRLHGYPARVQPRKLDQRTLYVVKIGPYKSRASAEKKAQRLGSREKLPNRIVEE